MRAEGLEPPRAVKLRGFSYRLRLSPPRLAGRVCGLDYPFTVPGRAGVRCCPSSLYTFPAGRLRPGLARDRHMTGFPEFGQFCSRRFPGEHSSFPQVRCVCHSATPAERRRFKLAEHTGGGGPLEKWGRGALRERGKGSIGTPASAPPLSCERVRGGAGGPAPLLRWWREPFSEKPKPQRTFKSAAGACFAIPAR